MTATKRTRTSRDNLERDDALHVALTQVVLEGGDLAQIAAELADALDVGVLITSSDGRERAAAMPQELREALAGAEMLDPTGRFRVEKTGTQGVPVGDGQVRMLRVVAGGDDLARLVCVRAVGSITDADIRAMERASAVAALYLTRQQAVTTVENKYRGDFLRDVFLRRAGDAAYVVEHAAGFGWNLARPVVVVAAELDPPPADEPISQARRRQFQERFAAAWRQVSLSRDADAASVDFSSEVVTLLGVAADADAGEVTARAVRGVAGDRGGGRRSFSVGVGRVAAGVADLPEAYAQARRCRVRLRAGNCPAGH